MCILACALGVSAQLPFVLLFNRDEAFSRESAPMRLWPGERFAAGCDLLNQGTWLGVGMDGSFCALTNYWEDIETEAAFNAAPSVAIDATVSSDSAYLTRGSVPLRFLHCGGDFSEAVAHIRTHSSQYKSFNLVYGSATEGWAEHLCVAKSGFQSPVRVTSGVHTISNGGFDGDWDKTQRLRESLQSYLSGTESAGTDGLFALLSDRRRGRKSLEGQNDEDTAVFVETHQDCNFGRIEALGTVSSTVITLDRDNTLSYYERSFQLDQSQYRDSSYSFAIRPNLFA